MKGFFKESDRVVITGGSFVGTLDLTNDVLQSIPNTEILGHGVSTRPGKPMLIANMNGKSLLGLPGHPVSTVVSFHLFGKPVLKILSSLPKKGIWRQIKLKAKASRNIPSVKKGQESESFLITHSRPFLLFRVRFRDTIRKNTPTSR